MSPDIAVMIVDDDLAVRESLMESLFSRGLSLISAYPDAETALDRLHAGLRCHVLITDHNMPGMQGLEFLVHVRTHFEEVVVIFHTDDEAAGARAIARGARFARKPVAIEAVIDEVLEEIFRR